MTATTKNSLNPADDLVEPDVAIEPAPASDDTAPDASAAPPNALTPRQHAFALSQAKAVMATDAEGDTEVDDHFDATFASAPPVLGEFRVPLSKLAVWSYHPKLGSREQGEHFHALMLTAAEPDDLRPIEVLPEADGAYPIFDGRYIYFALKKAHEGNEDVEVRCVLYNGTEAQAVQAVCDTTVGTIDASAMEKAQALYNHQRVNKISQRAIAERYPRLNKDKVSNMLIAARMRQLYPALFDILIAPDQAPISYGNDILTLNKALSPDEFQAVLDRAEDLAANGDRCKPNEAFDVLDVDRGDEADPLASKLAKPKPIVPIESEPILGHDDLPVAAYERLADNVDRIRLPDASTMTLAEREAAAEACIVQVRRHFRLDEQG